MSRIRCEHSISQSLDSSRAAEPNISVEVFIDCCHFKPRFWIELVERNCAGWGDAHDTMVRSNPDVFVMVSEDRQNLELPKRGRQVECGQDAALQQMNSVVGPNPQATGVCGQEGIDLRILELLGNFGNVPLAQAKETPIL